MKEQTAKKGLFMRFMDAVERAGNKLPDPFSLFCIITAIVVVIAAIAALCGVSATHPVTGDPVVARTLFSREGVAWLFSSFVGNFSGFSPLGIVLVMMMGVGLAEQCGLVGAVIKKSIMKVPLWAISLITMFLAINGSVTADAACLLMPPLVAAAYKSLGKNPLVGLIAAYAGTTAGGSACLLLTGFDPMLSSITQEAVNLLDPSFVVNPSMNWYFMIVSTVLLTLAGWFVTDKILTPRLGDYQGTLEEDIISREITAEEHKGLRAAGIACLAYIALILVMLVPQNGLLRGANGVIIGNSPFFIGIVFVFFLFFVIVALAYGLGAGTIKNGADVSKMMTESMKGMAGYVVLVLIISQFVGFFNWSNLGTILAVKGSEFLQSAGVNTVVLCLGLLIFSTLLNLLIGSGSSKWAFLAPILVPMLMLMDLSPATTQVVYRIADSATDNLSPLYSYFPMLLAYAKRYDSKVGMGTIISLNLPYSVVFLLVWSLQLLVWLVLKLPLGPGFAPFL